MTWMLTHTGATFDLRFVREADISALAIAHSLATTNRYTGHAARPNSVAEHSLLVEEIMQRELGVRDPDALLAGLLHDAHEAYTGDLSAPMKELIGAAWSIEEDRIERHVLQHFGALAASIVWHAQIKQADLIARATERRDLLPAGGPEWPSLRDVQPVTWINLRQRDGMSWQDWETAWLDRFAVLYSLSVDGALEGAA